MSGKSSLRRASACLATMAGLSLASASHAEVLAGSIVLPDFTMSTNGQDCGFASQPIVRSNLSGAKSSAILAGAPSALDAIRQQQATTQLAPAKPVEGAIFGRLPVTVAAGVRAADACYAEPGAIRFATKQPIVAEPLVAIGTAQSLAIVSTPVVQPLPGQERTGFAIPRPVPLAQGSAGRSDVFLDAPRIAIKKTPFDVQWQKVGSRKLARAAVVRTMGSAPSARESMLGHVNAWVNRQVRFVDDRSGHDIWADARTTLAARKGDCEDIAILKYHALAALGISTDDMYVTVARDLVRNADHALLVVRNGGGFVVLDNSTDELLDGAPDNGYRAILSYSGSRRWLHGRAEKTTIAATPGDAVHLSRNELERPRAIGFSK